MAEEPKHKTPTELGEAVGRKIEELFGDLLGENSIAEPDHAIETRAQDATRDHAPPTGPECTLQGRAQPERNHLLPE